MFNTTLFSSYIAAQHYFQLLAKAHATPINKEALLHPMDAYLFHQLAAYHQVSPVIIDATADLTHGGTAAMWASFGEITQQLIVPSPPNPTTESLDWRSDFDTALKALQIPAPEITFLNMPLDHPQTVSYIESCVSPLTPMIAVVSIEGLSAEQTNDLLAALFAIRTQLTVIISSLPQLGTDRALQGVLQFCDPAGEYRVLALRETHPFLTYSRLGVVFRAGESMPDIVERIQQHFEGNFDFLNLVQHNIQLVMDLETAQDKITALENQIKDAKMQEDIYIRHLEAATYYTGQLELDNRRLKRQFN